MSWLRMSTRFVVAVSLCVVACGAPTPAPVSGPRATAATPVPRVFPPSTIASPAVMRSSCAESGRDGQVTTTLVAATAEGRAARTQFHPACFPDYFYSNEGYFTDNGRPIPILGRTCGHFDVLVLFSDTERNRELLLANGAVPAPIRDRVAAGDVLGALRELLGSYTMDDLNPWRGPPPPVSIGFTVSLTEHRAAAFEGNASLGASAGFTRHHAVVLLDDLGSFSGQGVRRWPKTHPLFHGDGYILNIHPRSLVPGLVGNELLRRNLPVQLSEYLIQTILTSRDGVYVDRWSTIVNPRTGEDISAPLFGSVAQRHIAGYEDVDRDGVTDCLDPTIAADGDNVDGDFVPDRFDPDLSVQHRAYWWTPAPR